MFYSTCNSFGVLFKLGLLVKHSSKLVLKVYIQDYQNYKGQTQKFKKLKLRNWKKITEKYE